MGLLQNSIHSCLLSFVVTFIPITGAIAQNVTNPNSEPSPSILVKGLEKHWAKSFIQGLANRNLISPDQSFQPDQKVTRAEFAVIIDRSFPFKPAIRQAIAFNDIPANFWAASSIQNAYVKGFWSGTDLKSFRPQEYLTRSQAMMAIANGLNLPINLKQDPKRFLFSIYTDAALIPQAAIASIATLTEKQIIVNYPNVRELNPNALITRAELAALIYQSLAHSGQLPKISSNLIASNSLLNANNQNIDVAAKGIITHLKVSLRRREVVAYQGDKKLKTYPLGVGKAGWETPTGSYRVKQIIRNPDWKNPFTGDVIKAKDPDNPLGGFWIGFWTNGKEWSGFHATSQRNSVGRASSHGCLRMYKEDIKAIFSLVTPATIVEIKR